MRKCPVCGKRLMPTKEDVYRIPVAAFFKLGAEYHECMDCPQCGCQVLLNTRYGCKEEPKKEVEVK